MHNIITHITTSCNYDCSYCDVVKDKRFLSSRQRENILSFIAKNQEYIQRFKFFGGEPLLAFHDMKYIIDKSHDAIGNNYEIVTNTSLLRDEIGAYFQEYFSHIFFSIDSENEFEYQKVLAFVAKYKLEKKLYFNLIISPGKEDIALAQYRELYGHGMRGFNILPVYFTQSWDTKNLKNFSRVMKQILDISLLDSELRLYGFKENTGYDSSLSNNTIFIDVDGQIYYSDVASTFSGKEIQTGLRIGDIENFSLSGLGVNSFGEQKKQIRALEEEIYNRVQGQRELHKIMDYFSHYLTINNG